MGSVAMSIDPKALELLRLLVERPEIAEAAMRLASNPEALERLAPPEPTILDLFGPYELAHKPTATNKGLKSWHSCHRIHFQHLLPFFGPLKVTQVTVEKAEEYQRLRLGQKRLARGGNRQTAVETKHNTAPATVNNEIATLKALLNWAIRRHKITQHLLGSLKDLRTDDDPEHDRRFPIPYEHFVKILAELPPMSRLMMIFAFETGMRRDEFRLLQWSEVDLESDVKTVFLSRYRTKAKKERTVILSDTAVSVLKSVPRWDPSSPYVFQTPYKSDGTPVAKSTLGEHWRIARTRAGVRGPQGQAYWIHSVRKSYGANKAMSGMPIYMLMEQLGHNSKEIHDEYTKMSPVHRSALVEHVNKPPPRVGPRPITAPASQETGQLSELLAAAKKDSSK